METDNNKTAVLPGAQQRVIYKDLYFRLIICIPATHIMIMVGEDISSLKAFTIPSYYLVFAINYVITLLLAYLVKRVTLYLDGRYRWENNLWLRAILQLAMGIGLISLGAFFLVFLYFAAFDRDVMASGYTKYELPLSIALITILNLFYVCYHFWTTLQWERAEREYYLKKEQRSSTPALLHIMVHQGAEVVPLATDDIAMIYKLEHTMLVCTFDRERYVCDRTLEELELGLDAGMFFRLNRQLIVNISSCKRYEMLEYGRLRVILDPEAPLPAIVSQRKAPLFKRWIADNVREISPRH